MNILTIRTDKPEAEIGLYHDQQQLRYDMWEAHRELAETIHKRLEALLQEQQFNWTDIHGIVCFEGPGSFTGLRIGLTVGNTLAYGLGIPIVAMAGEQWIAAGVERLMNGEADPLALPDYGAPPHITTPKR